MNVLTHPVRDGVEVEGMLVAMTEADV